MLWLPMTSNYLAPESVSQWGFLLSTAVLPNVSHPLGS